MDSKAGNCCIGCCIMIILYYVIQFILGFIYGFYLASTGGTIDDLYSDPLLLYGMVAISGILAFVIGLYWAIKKNKELDGGSYY